MKSALIKYLLSKLNSRRFVNSKLVIEDVKFIFSEENFFRNLFVKFFILGDTHDVILFLTSPRISL